LILKQGNFDPGPIDGFIGPQTRYALERWQNAQRAASPNLLDSVRSNIFPWPREKDVPDYFGAPGSNLITMPLPYPMFLAWDTSTKIRKFAINKACADSAQSVLKGVLKHYGPELVNTLGLSLFSGCYNNRSKRGGHTKSMHAYGVAIDFDSEHNQMRWGSDRARFAKSDYDAWWGYWEEAGGVSLGRERNYDWMHVQATRL
jgi:hypothetical protein